MLQQRLTFRYMAQVVAMRALSNVARVVQEATDLLGVVNNRKSLRRNATSSRLLLACGKRQEDLEF